MLLNLQRYRRLLVLFVGAVFVFLVAFVFYDMIFVEKDTAQQKNLQAFPKIQPKDLPDAAISLSKCVSDLQQCAMDDDCLACDESGKFKCTTVDQEGRYEINGIKVPKGKYCLPRTDAAPECNRYTGKWVWSTASDCPPDANGVFSSQCWKCVCLYPDLFYDQTDCSTQIACVNTSDKTFQSPEDQRKRNRLIGAPYAEYAGRYWDPNAVDSIGDPVLMENPYATDSKGRPKFYCECDARNARNQKEFIRLPNDPYTCHVDMCYNLGQRLSQTYACKNSKNQPCDPYETPQDCTCDCNCILNNSTTRPDGTCQVTAGMCFPGSVNNTYTGCNCGVYVTTECRSKQKNQTNLSLPECKDENNPFGQECTNPCGSKPCGTNGTCVFNRTMPGGYECYCSYPQQTDAQGVPLKWSMLNKSSCNSDNMCSHGNALFYGEPGYSGNIWCWAGASNCPVNAQNIDKRNEFKCCIPGKYMWDTWEDSNGAMRAQLRCLNPEEKDLPVGWSDVKQTGWYKMPYGKRVISSKCLDIKCPVSDAAENRWCTPNIYKTDGTSPKKAGCTD